MRIKGPGPRRTPARKWRAMGRIEHTLLDEGRASSPTDLRPSPATPPYHTKVTDVSICDRGPEPIRGVVHYRPGHLARPASYVPFPSRRRCSPLRWRAPWPTRVRSRHRPRDRRSVGRLAAHSVPLLGAPAPARLPSCHALAPTP